MSSQSRPEPAAERVGREVARTAHAQTIAISTSSEICALAGDEAADDHRGLARRDEADERAGLEEREHADEQVGPLAERRARVLDQLLEVRQLDRRRRRSATRAGDRDAAGDQEPALPCLRRRAIRQPASATARERASVHFMRRATAADGGVDGSAATRAASAAARARPRSGVVEEAEHGRAGAGHQRVLGAASRATPASAASIGGHSARAAASRSLTERRAAPPRAASPARAASSSSARARRGRARSNSR